MTQVLRRRYRMVGRVGGGGAGEVWLAEDQRLPGRQCAVKVMRTGAGEEGAALAARLRDEAAVLTALDHPGLPKVSDFWEAGGNAYLVMDYVPGRDLHGVLEDAWRHGRRLEESQVLAWAEDLCDVLTFLHRQSPPVLHRDVKPANIKLTPDGQTRLVDFGLARWAGDPEGRTVTVLVEGGSRPYQPLEQYGAAGTEDARSDLYALGATLYHLLAGRAPASAQERFLDPSSCAPLATLRPDLHANVARAVGAAMALHPAERPPSVEAFRALLHASVAPGTGWQETLRPNVWLIAGVLVMLLAALALSLAP